MVIFAIHSGEQLGGSTLNAGFVVKTLSRHSHTVYILNKYKNDEGSRYLGHCGARLLYFPMFSLRMNTTTILESSASSAGAEIVTAVRDVVKWFAGFYLTAKYLITLKPDVLYLTESALPQCLPAAALLKVPVVCEVQAELIKGRWGVRRWLYVALLNRVDALVGISRFHVEPFLERPGPHDHIHVVPNTVDADLVPAASARRDIHDAYDIQRGKKVVAYFGGANPIKGYDLYLDIVKHVSAVRDDTVFVFAGPFHHRFASEWAIGSATQGVEHTRHVFDYLEVNHLKDRMRIIGEVTDVVAIISQCDLIVSTNAFPHFSRTIIEAFYCAVPVVASDDKFSREVIESGVSGLLANGRNLPEWVANIHHALDDHDWSRRMGREGRAVYDSRFAEEIVAARITEIFGGLHAKQPSDG